VNNTITIAINCFHFVFSYQVATTWYIDR